MFYSIQANHMDYVVMFILMFYSFPTPYNESINTIVIGTAIIVVFTLIASLSTCFRDSVEEYCTLDC